MKLAYTCSLNIDDSYQKIIKDIGLYSGKFYNMALYEMKQNNHLSLYEYYVLFNTHKRSSYLQKHTYMHAIKQAMKDVKSFHELLKKYKENPEENQKPGYPRFKNEKRLMKAAFLKTAIRIRDHKLLLSIGKLMKSEQNIKCIEIVLPQEVYDFVSDKNIKMITLKQKPNQQYEVKFVYEIQVKAFKKTGDIMSIDLGVSNLAAITFNDSVDQILIDGNVLKSQIATFNKKIDELQSKEMKCVGSKNFKATKKMNALMNKRKGVVDYHIHKASRMIVNLAIEHDVKIIVIGGFKGIKQKNKIKYFVQIPHWTLKHQIKYKARKEGIRVIIREESYTSSVSSVDLEPVNEDYSDKSRRVLRGLFKSSFRYMNSDINGSLNILRKSINEKNIPRLIELVRDKGFRDNPIRLLTI